MQLVILVFFFVSFCIAQEAERMIPEKGPPLGNLIKQVDGHWSPYQVPDYPQDAKVHIVQRGDTLWDLAQQYLSDAYLWPQIWEKNPYVANPHWIYPGDPILIEEPKLVDQPRIETPPPPEITEEVEEPPVMDSLKTFPKPKERHKPVTFKVADIDIYFSTDAELYGTGILAYHRLNFNMFIVGAEDAPSESNFGPGEIVYINKGMRQNIYPGTRFQILRPIGEVHNPVTGKYSGYFYKQLGTLKVLISHDDNAVAEIDFATDMVYVGDGLLPFVEKPRVKKDKERKFQRFVGDNGKPVGNIVYVLDKGTIAGMGSVVFVDLGKNANLEVGQICTIYVVPGKYEKKGEFYSTYSTKNLKAKFDSKFDKASKQAVTNRSLPRVIVGELVILDVNDRTAKAKIIEARNPIEPGFYFQVQ